MPQSRALQYAKTVLLVYHRQPQFLELHLSLNKGMGADDNVHLALLDSAMQGLFLGAAEAPDEQCDGQRFGKKSGVEPDRSLARLGTSLLGADLRQVVADIGVVLLGQDLGGRHQCPLVSVGRSYQEGQARNNGLAAADFSLQQT